jgi:integrase
VKTRAFKKGEIRRLLDHLTGSRKDRNRALIVLAGSTGFRVSELLQLRAGDVLREGEIANEVHVRAKAMKGGKKSRTIRLNAKAKHELRNYLAGMVAQSCWRLDGYLFPGPHGRPMTRMAAWNMIRAAARRAGIMGAIGTHSLRKTFGEATHRYWLDRLAAGEKVDPMREVQKALGHSSVATTDAYLSHDPDRVSAAVDSRVMEMIFDE